MLKACGALLVAPAAVTVYAAAAIEMLLGLMSATAAVRHGCLRNFGVRGLLGMAVSCEDL